LTLDLGSVKARLATAEKEVAAARAEASEAKTLSATAAAPTANPATSLAEIPDNIFFAILIIIIYKLFFCFF
jgi:hypothetical protein